MPVNDISQLTSAASGVGISNLVGLPYLANFSTSAEPDNNVTSSKKPSGIALLVTELL